MSNLSEIIKERSTPGILIFYHHGRLLYSNQQALEMLAAMPTEDGPSVSALEEIFCLCAPMTRGTGAPDSKR